MISAAATIITSTSTVASNNGLHFLPETMSPYSSRCSSLSNCFSAMSSFLGADRTDITKNYKRQSLRSCFLKTEEAEVTQLTYSTKDHKRNNLPEIMNALLRLGTYLLSLQSNSSFLSTPHFWTAIWMQTHGSLTGLVIITLKLADNYCTGSSMQLTIKRSWTALSWEQCNQQGSL